MIIGITGTSGSGKTTLGNILAKRNNIIVIDADKEAKELNKPGTEYMNSIEKELGKQFILEDGNLNRKELANEIYNNDSSREKLNSLTFQYVIDAILEKIKRKSNEETKYIFIDAPLLFESGLENFCDYTISLISDYHTKIKRICERDNIEEAVAKKRLQIQHEDDYYIQKSDFVIYNNDCSLEEEIERILKKIEEK